MLWMISCCNTKKKSYLQYMKKKQYSDEIYFKKKINKNAANTISA